MPKTLMDLLDYEIENGTQRSAGVLYGVCMEGLGGGDGSRCQTVNRAIIDRWSRSGLERVKKIAHKMRQEMSATD